MSDPKQVAQRLFDHLSRNDKWQIGDDLVRGDFEWQDYWQEKPSNAVIREIDRIRTEWEDEQ